VLAEMGCFQPYTGIMTGCRKRYVNSTGTRLRIVIKAHLSKLPLSDGDRANLDDFERRLQWFER
jgi:hypothetical protein